MALFGSNKNTTEIIISGDNKGAMRAIGGVTRELDRAEREIGKMSRGWGNALGAFGNVNPIYLAGGAALAAAGGFTMLVKNTIEAGAELYKMSGRTGQSVEALSALQVISERTGIAFNDLLILYKSGNIELDTMVKGLITAGVVMSTQAAKDAAVFKTEMGKLETVLTNLAIAVIPSLTEEVLKAKYMLENNSFWDILNPFNTDADLLKGYDAFKKKLYETTEATNQESLKVEELINKYKALLKAKEKINENVYDGIDMKKRNAWIDQNVLPGAANNAELMAMQNTHTLQMQMIEERKYAISEITDLEMYEWALMNDMAQETYSNMAGAAQYFYEASGQKSKEWFAVMKGFSIAQALINTYEGATKALAQGGIFGPILAASVIAFGLGQVAAIASQQPGGSYGGGGNTVGGNMPSVPREPRPSNTNNYGGTTIIIYGNVIDQDKFSREIIPSIEKAYRDGVGGRR